METRQNKKSPAGDGRSSTTGSQARAADSKRELGRYLADQRESMQMSLDQIARTTKIPKSSLGHLEAGRFDALPGDVFVRGFLRSYARCVHLDGDDVVRRYAQCGLMPAPVSGELADSFLAGKRRNLATGTQPPPIQTKPKGDADLKTKSTGAAKSDAKAEASGDASRNVLRDAFDLSKQHIARRVADSQARAAKSKAEASEAALRRSETRKAEAEAAAELPERSRTFIPPSFNFDEEMSRRGPLTLGVIILVIVATLTMSYLLRRPGTSTDGFTMRGQIEQPALEQLALVPAPATMAAPLGSETSL